MAGRNVRRFPTLMALAVVLFTACTSASATAPRADVAVRLVDFQMHASTTTAPAGPVTFGIHNDAPATHEFVVVRTDDPADQLPLASDGLSVDEDALTSAGELSDVGAGTIASLTLTLAPGHYVFFCNLDGHYLGGMHGSLDVTADG